MKYINKLLSLIYKAFRAYWNFFDLGHKHLISASYNFKEELMTLEYSDGSEAVFKGSGTVWHRLPYLERCDTDMEARLVEYWEYNKHWKGPYPWAHLKKLNEIV